MGTGGGPAADIPKSPHVRRPTRHAQRGQPLQRGEGDLHLRGTDAPDLDAGRGGDPRGGEDAAGPARRLPDARCQGRRALCRQGAGAEEPGHQIYPGRAADRSGCCGWSRRPASMQIVTTNNEAEALLLEAQLIKRYRPPYNVLLRDDKSFPFILLREDHAFPRVQLHRGARRLQGPILRPVRQRRLGPQHAEPRCRSCSCCAAAPTASSPTARGPACSTRSAAARRPASAGSTRPAMTSWSSDAKDFLGGKSTKVQAKLQALMTEAVGGDGFRAGRGLSRPPARADLYPGQPGDPRRAARRRRHLRARPARAGRCASRPSSSAAARIGAQRSFFPAHTNDVPEAEVLPSFLVQFYEEVPPPRADPARPRGAGGASARRGLHRARRSARSSSRSRSAASRRRMIRQAARNAEEELDRRLAETSTQARNLRELAERSSWPSRRSGSRSTTTATSWAPTRSAR